jgi:hypothetical protein
MAKNSKNTKTQGPKLSGTKLDVAVALVDTKDTGIGPGTWNGDGKFPTRTLKALEQAGYAKSKEKKLEDGKKGTFFFPTAATQKAIDRAQA